MSRRWVRVGALAVGLIAVNAVARLVVRFRFEDDLAAQDRIALVALGAVAVAMAAVAVAWGRRFPQSVAVTDLGVAGALGALVSILAGPLIAGAGPFQDGAGGFFGQLGLYAGFAAGGALIGLCTLIALGQDHKSRSLKEYVESRLTKPRRI